MRARLTAWFVCSVRQNRFVEDEGGQTLVEMSVSLVLSVLALGFAMALAVGSFRALKVWQGEAALVNAFEQVSRTVDQNLAAAVLVERTADSTWVLWNPGYRGRADSVSGGPAGGGAAGHKVVIQSSRGSVTRNGQSLNDSAVHAVVDIIVLPHEPNLVQSTPRIVRARVSVRLGRRTLESDGAVIVRPSSAWDSP